jgi:DNA polymerase elongation subunit (family B)
MQNREYRIEKDSIVSFLYGKDNEEGILNIGYDKNTNLIHKIKRDADGNKIVETEALTAFLWMKNLGELKVKYNFYGQNQLNIRVARQKYGIEITALDHGNHPRLENGYKYLVKCKTGLTNLFKFFKEGGLYRGLYDKTDRINEHFLILDPVEQYLISTGKRMYKGYHDYNEVERFVFDLETTGLDPKVSRIFLIGCKTNKGLEVIFDCETEGENADKSEAIAIISFFNLIADKKPDTISGYYSANFDWNFIFTRCEILGLDITKIAKTLHKDRVIYNTEGTLKIGSDVEKYTQTNMFGYSIVDVIHSVRRAQAIDSNMKETSLKYISKYNKVAKSNRVYIKGDNIGNLWHSEEEYYFDNKTGKYLINKPTFTKLDNYDEKNYLNDDNNVLILIDDNIQVEKSNNIILIPCKKDGIYLNDNDLENNKKIINVEISNILNRIKTGAKIDVPNDLFLDKYIEFRRNSPNTFSFILGSLKTIESYVNNNWIKVKGNYIVNRYLMDDLQETLDIDYIYNQAPFMLSQMVPSMYQKIYTMGTAALWKMIMLAWSYENNLAIPISSPKRDYVGGLSRLLSIGFSKDVRKADFNSLYPAIGLAHDLFPDVDISGVMKPFLKFFLDERFGANNLSKKYAKEGDYQNATLYKRKQLPLKIFINAFSGSLGAPDAFNWSETDIVEGITCRARQYLRLMVKFFMKRGYKPSVLDTDGVNFIAPQNEESFRYVGLGLNSNVKKDEVYTGVKAIVAEFNDLYMKGEMGLGLDGTWPSCINVSKKNYALLEDDGGISLTGNTLKSKAMPKYIEEFINEGMRLLLNDKGYEFVMLYYEYVENIFNMKIPLSKIATKSKVKKSIDDYINRGFNKNGAKLPKQAHMELAIRDNVKVNIGDVLLYVNNGSKKNEGDVQTIKKCKLNAKELREYVSKYGNKPGDKFYDVTENINCYLLDNKEIEENPNKVGYYNAAKYLDMFNTRVEKLLVVFDKSIRDDIIITNPDQKKNWFKSELKLVNNQPIEDGDLDSVDEFFTVSEGEYAYWDKYGYNPNIWSEDNMNFYLPEFDKPIPV